MVENPKALLWLESSLTALHIMHMAQLSRSLQAKGFEVLILTSEDTMKKFAENGGEVNVNNICTPASAIDFGRAAKFMPLLASQTTYSQPQITKVVDTKGLPPFDFIGSSQICKMRADIIENVLANEKPDALVFSLWPAGYGPFTPEIESMIKQAKQLNPDCKVYSLLNDIPYTDNYHNDPFKQEKRFNILDRAFIRGDGTIPIDNMLLLEAQDKCKVSYVGHFIDPLPDRTEIFYRNRKVLVTYGARESQWGDKHFFRYFSEILKAAPHTMLAGQPWELIIGPNCSQQEFGEIETKARYISSGNAMRINVVRGMPDEAFRQATADAIFRIAQYDLFVLDDVSTGVPALITVGTMERYTCGSADGEQRVRNLKSIGAPVDVINQRYLSDQRQVADKIDRAYLSTLSTKKNFHIETDAPNKVGSIMASDCKLIKPSRWGTSTLSFSPEIPDTVITVHSTSQIQTLKGRQC